MAGDVKFICHNYFHKPNIIMIGDNNTLIDFSEDLGKLVKSKLDLSKLEMIDSFSTIGSSMVSYLLIGICFLFFMLFISIGAVVLISKFYDNYVFGFTAVAGFYFLIAIILLIGKKSIIDSPLRNKIIRMIFSS